MVQVTRTRCRFAAAFTVVLGAAAISACASRPVVPTNDPQWAEMTVRATGRGAYPATASGPQARLMAQRAARADAYRQLTEQVYGLEVSADTLVRDAVLADDRIETDVEGFIRGARVVATRNRPGLEIVELDMELDLGQDFLRLVLR